MMLERCSQAMMMAEGIVLLYNILLLQMEFIILKFQYPHGLQVVCLITLQLLLMRPTFIYSYLLCSEEMGLSL